MPDKESEDDKPEEEPEDDTCESEILRSSTTYLVNEIGIEVQANVSNLDEGEEDPITLHLPQQPDSLTAWVVLAKFILELADRVVVDSDDGPPIADDGPPIADDGLGGHILEDPAPTAL